MGNSSHHRRTAKLGQYVDLHRILFLHARCGCHYGVILHCLTTNRRRSNCTLPSRNDFIENVQPENVSIIFIHPILVFYLAQESLLSAVSTFVLMSKVPSFLFIATVLHLGLEKDLCILQPYKLRLVICQAERARFLGL
jgi:hypothetical protein